MCPFVADDEAVGMGGTIAKYVSEGFNIVKAVFSYGESSHPHFQEAVMISKRIEETEKASKFIGIEKTIFLGLRDTKVKADVETSNAMQMVKDLIKEYKPIKIYIPSSIDPHPDHQAVNKTVLCTVDSFRKKYPVYEFEVWNILQGNKPMLFEDITNFYKKKLKYMKYFTSQWQYMYLLWLPVYFRSRQYGKKHGCKLAEKFYKVR
ncbi:MAG: PIG-L family deacetylase [Nanoarchaeota archaeon]|nr:PIG-L family deacetylase [Nanoarchaeota archaeon]MBU4352332.1 PIG-L family deacetylase [Nanoarchaeota archaeon]MBU4456227.1 PIG-L family deacetylase [Nanoarchaeota archaeon]MCG2719964.1 PIG-L family deacetylase [Nanoarchaeota archaeon]